MLRRISKREAFRLFTTTDRVVTLCPCKFVPYGGFSMGSGVFGPEWLDRAERYTPKEGEPVSIVWQGTRERTAWGLMHNNWCHYNASYETGYYAHYYVWQD